MEILDDVKPTSANHITLLHVWFVNHTRHGAGELFSILITTLSCHCWVLISVMYNLCYLYGNSGITAFLKNKNFCVLQLFCSNVSVNKVDWLTVNKFFYIMLSKFCNVYLFYLLCTLYYHQEHYLFRFQFHFSHNELSLQVTMLMNATLLKFKILLNESSWCVFFLPITESQIMKPHKWPKEEATYSPKRNCLCLVTELQ